jgi:hypothetical protein
MKAPVGARATRSHQPEEARDWDEVYDLDVKTLRDMVGRTPRRYEQGPRKKRRLIHRSIDIQELDGALNPMVRECVPFIRKMERELDHTREQARRLLVRTRALEDEVNALKDVEKHNIVVVNDGLEAASFAEEELDPGQQEVRKHIPISVQYKREAEVRLYGIIYASHIGSKTVDLNTLPVQGATAGHGSKPGGFRLTIPSAPTNQVFARLLGRTRKDIRKINKLVATAGQEESRARGSVEAVLRQEFSMNQEGTLEVERVAAIFATHPELLQGTHSLAEVR